MMKNMDGIKQSSLFFGIEEKELKDMLNCFSAYEKVFQKGEFVFHWGDKTQFMGVVLSGAIHIIKEDFWGGRTIIGQASSGEIFAETYACISTEPLQVSVLAAETSEVLFLNIYKVLCTCTSACVFHTRLIENLISILARKNLMLTQKIEHMSKKTTREKLLSYLSAESIKNGSTDFVIPFNRQQMAEYLAVDRSAMSNELCKLRDDGMLTFHRNKFYLKERIF